MEEGGGDPEKLAASIEDGILSNDSDLNFKHSYFLLDPFFPTNLKIVYQFLVIFGHNMGLIKLLFLNLVVCNYMYVELL